MAKRVLTAKVGQDVEQLQLLHIAGGNVKLTATLEISLATFKIFRYTHITPSSHFTTWYLPKRNEGISPHKDMYNESS